MFMKKYCIVLLLLLSASGMFAQNGKVYKWKSAVPIPASSNDFGVTFHAATPALLTPVNSLIKIVSQSGNDVVFYFLSWGTFEDGNVRVKPSKLALFEAYNIGQPAAALTGGVAKAGVSSYTETSYLNSVVYFKIAKSVLNEHAEEVESSVNVGAITMPFKIRLEGRQFENDFPLGLAITCRLGLSKFSLVGALGYGSVSLTDENAKKLGPADKVSDLRIFSWGAGILYKINSIQLIAMAGWDYLSGANQDKYGWNYNGKTYISFGIGASLFKLSKTETGN